MENCPTLPLFTPRHNIPPHCHLSSIFFLWNTRTEKTYRIRVEGVTLSYACAASGTVSIVPRHRQRRRPQGCIPDVAVGLTKRPGLPFLPSRSSACHGNNVLCARKAVRGLALAFYHYFPHFIMMPNKAPSNHSTVSGIHRNRNGLQAFMTERSATGFPTRTSSVSGEEPYSQ